MAKADVITETSGRVVERGTARGTVDLGKSDMFHLLSNRRRRLALHYLKQCGEPVALSDLAEQVAAWENDTSIERLSSSDRKNVYVSLHQSHLPQMDDAGVVEYDRSRSAVRLCDRGERLSFYLEVVPKNQIPWSEYYLGLSAVCAALVAAVWAGAYPFTLLPPIAWMAVVVVLFAGSSVAHVYNTRRMRLGHGGPPSEVEAGKPD